MNIYLEKARVMTVARFGRLLTRTVLVMLLVSLPVTLLLLSAIQAVRREESVSSFGGVVGGAVTIYLAIVVPATLGVVLYVICLAIVLRMAIGSETQVALVLVPTALIPWCFFSVRELLMFWPFMASLGVALVVLGVFAGKSLKAQHKHGADPQIATKRSM